MEQFTLFFAAFALGVHFFSSFLPLKTTPRKLFIFCSLFGSVLWLAAFATSILPVFVILAAMGAAAAWNFNSDSRLPGKLFLGATNAAGVALAFIPTELIKLRPGFGDADGIWLMTSVYSSALMIGSAIMVAIMYHWIASVDNKDERPELATYRNFLNLTGAMLVIRLLLFIAFVGAPYYGSGFVEGADAYRHWMFEQNDMASLVLARVVFGFIAPVALLGLGLNLMNTERRSLGSVITNLAALSVVLAEFAALIIGF